MNSKSFLAVVAVFALSTTVLARAEDQQAGNVVAGTAALSALAGGAVKTAAGFRNLSAANKIQGIQLWDSTDRGGTLTGPDSSPVAPWRNLQPTTSSNNFEPKSGAVVVYGPKQKGGTYSSKPQEFGVYEITEKTPYSKISAALNEGVQYSNDITGGITQRQLGGLRIVYLTEAEYAEKLALEAAGKAKVKVGVFGGPSAAVSAWIGFKLEEKLSGGAVYSGVEKVYDMSVQALKDLHNDGNDAAGAVKGYLSGLSASSSTATSANK